jgi:uncharacterized protein
MTYLAVELSVGPSGSGSGRPVGCGFQARSSVKRMTQVLWLMGPLLTLQEHAALLRAAATGTACLECSLDLGRTRTTVEVLGPRDWIWKGARYGLPDPCRDRTIYHWVEGEFRPVARFGAGLIKLVPTQWGPPTFEIDGIKMVPTAHLCPYQDAKNKVGLVRPRGRVVLDTCGGLGYFASCCLESGAARVLSYEKNPDVIWLRGLNPWSPSASAALTLTQGDIAREIVELPSESVDAILHDPPRFGIAGELYSQAFYDQLSRVIRRRGRLFHYTGTPNKLTSGRDVPNEVANRLSRAGFATRPQGDGMLATRLSD